MAHDVFVSYSSKDKPIADATCAKLEARGIRCWIAPRDILPGVDWSASIIDAINGARALVLVFSAHANASQQIKREVERAVNKGIPIIPLRIENVQPEKSLEFFISTPHWLDAFSPPMERHLNYLADVLVHILEGKEVPEPLPPPPPPWWRGRLGMAVAACGLVLLAAVAWFSFLRPPPGFAGTWTATALDIRQFNTENAVIGAEVPAQLLGNTLKGPDTKGVLTIDPSGQFTLSVSGQDEGTVTAQPENMTNTNILTFVSDVTHQSFSVGALLFKVVPNGGGQAFSPQTDPPPDGQTPYTLDLFPAHANIGPFTGQPDYQGSPDANGNMRTLDLIAGAWTPEAFGQPAADANNTVSGSLTLTRGGHYTLTYSLLEKSLFHAANGNWTRTIPAVNGAPVNLTDGGTYVFNGRDQVTLYDQIGASTWQRSP